MALGPPTVVPGKDGVSQGGVVAVGVGGEVEARVEVVEEGGGQVEAVVTRRPMSHRRHLRVDDLLSSFRHNEQRRRGRRSFSFLLLSNKRFALPRAT